MFLVLLQLNITKQVEKWEASPFGVERENWRLSRRRGDRKGLRGEKGEEAEIGM